MIDLVGIIIAITMLAGLVHNNRLPGQVVTRRNALTTVMSVVIPTTGSGAR